MSIKIKGCYLYKTNGNGGKRQTALRPEKIILPCGTVSIALPPLLHFYFPNFYFCRVAKFSARLLLPSTVVCLLFP